MVRFSAQRTGIVFSGLEAERIEVGIAIEVILIFDAFEEVDDAIGKRRSQDFPENFQEVVMDHDLDYLWPFPAGDSDKEEGTESEGVEDSGVYGLTNGGRADGTKPEEASFGAYFKFREGDGVGKFSGPEGDQGGEDDAPGVTEGFFVDFLSGPAGGRGHFDYDEGHDGGEAFGDEADPDDASGAGIAVDFGEDITEEVADGKEEDAGAEGKIAYDGPFTGSDQVGADEDRDEGGHYEIVIAILVRRASPRGSSSL